MLITNWRHDLVSCGVITSRSDESHRRVGGMFAGKCFYTRLALYFGFCTLASVPTLASEMPVNLPSVTCVKARLVKPQQTARASF